MRTDFLLLTPAVTALRRHAAPLGSPLALALAALLLVALPGATVADEPELDPGESHVRIQNPADLSPEEAEALYQSLLNPMVEGYLRSDIYDIDYRDWRRLNTAPYMSDQHGARLVNVYANDEARGMLSASAGNPMPVGAKIAKDSISIVESGGTARGPLFMMEKMAPGFAPEFGDWRYTMIMPNGKLFGTTRGSGSSAVKFCGECHAQAAALDYLFPLPEEYLITE